MKSSYATNECRNLYYVSFLDWSSLIEKIVEYTKTLSCIRKEWGVPKGTLKIIWGNSTKKLLKWLCMFNSDSPTFCRDEMRSNK